ncbi:hypothetical protein [Haladaptatus sp. DFWS20]|uniref:hypothetical protein n=1 Tax=Haladaptatus sp. DFWS20 TaxID=3403467 RepID=UPI003EBBDE82
MFLYLAGKLAIVAVYYLVRLIPVVGLKLSNRYEHELFGPLVDDVSVVETRGERFGRSVAVELEFDNDSTLDARIVGGSVRLGYSTDGETVCNLVWTDDFESLPKNIDLSKIENEGTGTLRLEHCIDDDELHLDGELRLRRIFTVRGRELPLGVASFSLPEESVHIGSGSEKETERQPAAER